MARAVNPEKVLESLKKLYEKRSVLDKQIIETEKSFLSATSAQSGSAGAATKSAGRPKRKAPARKSPVKK